MNIQQHPHPAEVVRCFLQKPVRGCIKDLVEDLNAHCVSKGQVQGLGIECAADTKSGRDVEENTSATK